MDNSILDSALLNAGKGWFVIPLHSIVDGKCTCNRKCKSPGKHPIFSKWQSKASIDPGQINSWWKKYPDANIGILTGKHSGLVVVDIDPRNGGDVSLNDLCDSYAEFKTILDTYTVKTGGNGQHFYYAYHKPFKSAKKHALGDGIDIKADGGYILAPPSNHISGGFYELENDTEPLELPTILIDLITQNQTTSVPEIITEGNRNNWLAEQAGIQLRKGKTLKQVENYLLEQNTLHCQPPLDLAEVLSIAKSISAGFKPEALQTSFKTQWQQAILESGLGAGFSHSCLGLSLYMDVDGRSCWPTEEQLEERLHVTRKTIRQHLERAEQAGFLKRYSRSQEGKRGFN